MSIILCINIFCKNLTIIGKSCINIFSKANLKITNRVLQQVLRCFRFLRINYM